MIHRSTTRTSALCLLSCLLLMAAGCGKDTALADSPEIEKAKAIEIRTRLKAFEAAFHVYQTEHEGDPGTLAEIQAAAREKDVFADERGGAPVPFKYIPPGPTADDDDIFAHTSRAGPLPILAIKLNGKLIDFSTVEEFDQQIDLQNNRVAPKAPREGEPGGEPGGGSEGGGGGGGSDQTGEPHE